MRRGSISLVPAVVSLVAVAGFLLVLNMAITPPTQNSNTKIATTKLKTYTDSELGFRFSYDSSIAVADKLGSKAIVAWADSPEIAQTVERFTKKTDETLSAAIERQFLSSIDDKDCFPETSDAVLDIEKAHYPATFQLAQISYPDDVITDDQPFGEGSKCPTEYRKTNAVRFFLMDSAYPDRFFFFDIGQEYISISPTDGWHHSFRVTSVSSTSTNTNTTSNQNTNTSTSGTQFPITEWNVQMTVGENVTFLYMLNETDSSIASFSTTALSSEPYCKPSDGAVGVISRSKTKWTDGPLSSQTPIHIGDWYYYFTAPQATCSADATVTTNQTAGIETLRTVFRSLKESVSTADWKTYKNTKYNFSFKHPKDWTATTYNEAFFEDRARIAGLVNPGFEEPYGAVGGINVNIVAVVDGGLSFNEWFSKNAEYTKASAQASVDFMKTEGPDIGLTLNDITFSHRSTKLDGADVIIQDVQSTKPMYIEGGASFSRTYFVKKGSYIYQFAAGSPTGPEANALMKIFDQIMSTLDV